MVGVLGGTFDPIHFGHLRFAEEAAETLGLTELRLIPTGRPPHREMPVAAPGHRLAMTQLAVAGHPVLRADAREVESDAPSFTVTTLEAIRGEIGSRPLCLLIGADAFAGFATWRRWTELAGLAHIVVATRPGHELSGSLSPLLGEFWDQHFVPDIRLLSTRPAGFVALQKITALDISASRIRALLRAGCSARYLLPDAVLEYIGRTGLYREKQDPACGP